MTTDWIFGWWNLVYLAPFLLALIYLGVYAASGITFGEVDTDVSADADADVDADVDADADADVDADADGDLDHDVDHDLDHHVDGAHGHGGGQSSVFMAMSILGVGRVPVSLVLMLLFMSWGAIGFAANALASNFVTASWQMLVFSIPVAFVASVAITGTISRTVGRFVPMIESSAHRRHELLGNVGHAVFAIDETSGVVSVRDSSGNLLQVDCRIDAGRTPIPKGSAVKLVAYNAPRNVFFGIQNNPTDASQKVSTAPAHVN